MRPDAAAGLPPPPGMTVEEWADMDEDEPGELVDGQLEDEEVTTAVHEAVVAWLIRVLGAWVIPRGGWVFGSEWKLAVSTRRGRKPDVTMFLPGGRAPSRGSRLSKAPPGVVIEVITPTPRDGRRDRVEKLGEYARFGVRLYWLIDPALRVVEVLELGPDGRYTLVLAEAAGVVSVPGCEGLALDLDALWGEVDGLPEDDGA